MAPATWTELSSVRSAIRSTYTVSSRTAIPPGQAVEADRRILPPERRVRDLDGVVHRLVLEGQLRVEVIDADLGTSTPEVPTGSSTTIDASLIPIASIAIGDAGPCAIGFLLLLLDQPADRPGIALAPQVQTRLVQPDLVDRSAPSRGARRCCSRARDP